MPNGVEGNEHGVRFVNKMTPPAADHSSGSGGTGFMADGNCQSLPPIAMFPSDGVGVDIAKRVCATCPVKEPCLEYALRNGLDHGVWGGTSERERRRIAKRRRLERAAANRAMPTKVERGK